MSETQLFKVCELGKTFIDALLELLSSPGTFDLPATDQIKSHPSLENGPCPLLALCNTLILQGKVTIQPYDRPSIGYDHLLELLADYLLDEEKSPTISSTTTITTTENNSSGQGGLSEKLKSWLEIESALRLVPHLEHGLDMNVFFKSICGFESMAELSLFHTFGIKLMHGWMVSPVIDVAMYTLFEGPATITSYNKAVECTVSGDDAGGGPVVEDLEREGDAPLTIKPRWKSGYATAERED
ncbi:hypothetical protein BG006_001043 [Podila minutissima]|uniref:MINDY deubiquitinase domain-containing protein n=1 Tax=Podila minutissima TaxID=64525 RepID=A0A9P5SD80_9FUNG|nr:hypothetical protein BG006_001043 [Podila minutissima]